MTAILPAPRQRVFKHMSDIEKLPEWATEFARQLNREGEDYKVVNGLGEFYFSIEADAASGVIDMYAGPAEDQLALFPTRVVSLGTGKSAYSFTMFKAPGMPDDLFESQHKSLRREFDNIRRHFAAPHLSCAR